MKNISALLVCCILMLAGGPPLLAQQLNQARVPAESIQTGGPAAAQAATDVWLGLVDDAQYAKAWQTTSSLFQSAVPQERWNTVANTRRTPLGKLLSRKLVSAAFTKILPGAPLGQYVILQYTSSFEHKKSASETATATLDKDGQWKVSGYIVH